MLPGATAFTRMPYPPHSAASPRVSPMTAALAVPYGTVFCDPIKALMDEMLTMLPPRPAAAIRRPAA